ncbi:MAG: hypothetical protein ACK5Q5_00635 [Planctomycetaceae bacterium]
MFRLSRVKLPGGDLGDPHWFAANVGGRSNFDEDGGSTLNSEKSHAAAIVNHALDRGSWQRPQRCRRCQLRRKRFRLALFLQTPSATNSETARNGLVVVR